AQFTQDTGRRAHHQAARRNAQPRFHKSHGRHDAGFADDGLVHDDGIHAHHGIAPYGAAMQYRAMPDMPVDVDQRVIFGHAMNDTGILHIGAFAQDDAAEIAAQAGQRPHIDARPDDHVADQHGSGMDISGGVYNRRQAVDGIDFEHGASLRSMYALR